jgi:Skp family chaperone for outer membrane proteins
MNRLSIAMLMVLVVVGFVVGGAFYWIRTPIKIEPNVVKIAVIDSRIIKDQSVPFVKVRELLDKEHARVHEEIIAQELKLREEYEQIKNSEISAELKQQQKLEFDKKVALLEQRVQKIKDKIGRQFSWLTEHVEVKLNEVIKGIVSQYGFNIVLNMTIQETRAVLYADGNLDITLEVIKRLDKMLPDLRLPPID